MSEQIVKNKIKVVDLEFEFEYPNRVAKFSDLFVNSKPFAEYNRGNRGTGIYFQFVRLRCIDKEHQGLCALMQGNRIFKICNYIDVLCDILNGLYEITNISKVYVNFNNLNYTLVRAYNKSLTYTSATNAEISYIRRELRNQLGISTYVDKVEIVPKNKIDFITEKIKPRYPWGSINYKLVLKEKNIDGNISTPIPIKNNEVDESNPTNEKELDNYFMTSSNKIDLKPLSEKDINTLPASLEESNNPLVKEEMSRIKKRKKSDMATQEKMNPMSKAIKGEDIKSIPEISTTMNVEERKPKSLFNSELSVTLHITDLVSVGAEQYARFSEFGDVLLPINKLLWSD